LQSARPECRIDCKVAQRHVVLPLLSSSTHANMNGPN
jgi:hypothetical protein